MVSSKSNMGKYKGITLIALVITIVVLLILAGISVMMLKGENGLISKAIFSREETRAAAVDEEKNMWKSSKVASLYTDDRGLKTLDELLLDLKNRKLLTDEEVEFIKAEGYVEIGNRQIFFTDDNIEKIKTLAELVANGEIKIGDYVEYPVEKLDGTYIIDKDDVLYNEDQIFDVNDYINGKWQILYTGEEGYGTQIVSSDNVLGNDHNGDFIIGDSKRDAKSTGAISYDNAIRVLNRASENYLNRKYAESSRMLGSNPEDTQDTEGIEEIYEIKSSYFTKYFSNLIMKVSDIRYEKDWSQLEKCPKLKNASNNIWLASREVEEKTENNILLLKCHYIDKKEKNIASNIVANYSMSWAETTKEYITTGIRPVIKLKNDVILAKTYDEEGNTVWKIRDKIDLIYRKMPTVVNIAKGTANAEGTEDDPYLISSVEDLVQLSVGIEDGSIENGKCFKLINDIDFNDESNYLNPLNKEFGDLNGDDTDRK